MYKIFIIKLQPICLLSAPRVNALNIPTGTESDDPRVNALIIPTGTESDDPRVNALIIPTGTEHGGSAECVVNLQNAKGLFLI